MLSRDVPSLLVAVFAAWAALSSANAEFFTDDRLPDKLCHGSGDVDKQDLNKKRDAAVFEVLVSRDGKQQPNGTATLVDSEKGIFLTAAHVVAFAQNDIIVARNISNQKYPVNIFPKISAIADWEDEDLVLLQVKSGQWDRPRQMDPFPLRIDGVDQYLHGSYFYYAEGATQSNYGEYKSVGIEDGTNFLQARGTVFAHASGTLVFDERGRAFALILRDNELPDKLVRNLTLKKLKRLLWEKEKISVLPLHFVLDKIKAIPSSSDGQDLIDELVRDGDDENFYSRLTKNNREINTVDTIHLIDKIFSPVVWKRLNNSGTLIEVMTNITGITCTHVYFAHALAQYFHQAAASEHSTKKMPESKTESDPSNAPVGQKSQNIEPGRGMEIKEAHPSDLVKFIVQLKHEPPNALKDVGLLFLNRALDAPQNDENLDLYATLAAVSLRRAADDPGIRAALDAGVQNRDYAALMGNLMLAEHLSGNNREAARRAFLAAFKLGGSPAADRLAAEYALDEQDPAAAGGFMARAYATLSEPNPRNEALRSQLTADFKKLAASAPVLADASIQNFRVSPSAPPNASRWYALAATDVGTSPSEPHSKKTQAAFLRTRTLNWYDVKWSKTTVNVNEEYEVTGKLHIMNAWPAAIQVPDQAFLNIGQPGAMANRLGVWVGGEFTPRSMKLELGKTYDFRVLLKARRPGHWHTHVQLTVMTGGPIPGPGQYIETKGNFADYTDDVKLLNGSTVDLETYGLGKISLWHILFWATALTTWLWYLFRERRLLGRLVAVAIRKDEEPITRKEWLVGAVTLGAVLGAVIIFAILSAYSNMIPLQGDNISEIKPRAEEPAPINVEYLGATYKVLDRELRANLKITNEAKAPLQISEFASGGLRFISKENYPDYLLADRTLSLNDDNPIQPDETRNIALTVQDAKWDTESLLGLDLSNNVDRSFAGLLFLNTPSGKRYPVEVAGPVSLNFH